MTTTTDTQNTAYEAPPALEVGVLGWIKKNLFASWFDGILTILSLAFLYVTVVPTIRWAFTTANWSAITQNITILMQGRYDQDQSYRIAICVLLLIILGIVSPFVYNSTNPNLKTARQILNISWFLSFPVIWIILYGIKGIMPIVSMNDWGGLLLTFILTFIGIVFAFPIGLLLALGRRSNLPIVRWLCVIYIEAVRGVPLITVLFMSFIMLPLFVPGDIRIAGIIRASVAVTLFSAAYLAENVRGGLQSISRGQNEAAQALGLNTFQEMYLIILPQALRAVIPALMNQFLGLFKDTTLVAIVGLFDFLGVGKSILAQPGFLGTQKEVYAFLAIVYFIFAFAMSNASIKLERRLGVGTR